MELTKLNPIIRSAVIYEKLNRKDECIGYESRIIYLISGDLSATVEGVKLGHLSPGNLLYIPSGVGYKLKGQYFRAAVITFDPTDEHSEPEVRIPSVPVSEYDEALCHSVKECAPFDKFIFVKDMESERDTLIEMCNIYASEAGEYRARISAMLKLTLLKLAEAADENALPTRMIESLDSYIRENIGEEISNTEIGAIFGYHPFYVSKVLKDKRGQTLHQYIISYRLRLARQLLRYTDKNINEIAEECGFTDASYFTKAFRTTVGKTPKDFRAEFKDDFI